MVVRCYILKRPFEMTYNDDITRISGCTMVKANRWTDDRGQLFFAEGDDVIPFHIERVFWITNVPEGKSRGGHAHSTCAEVIFPIQGQCDIRVTDGRHEAVVHLDNPEQGILIPSNVWCDLHHFSPDCILLVAASQHYNVQGYVHNYDDFIERTNH